MGVNVVYDKKKYSIELEVIYFLKLATLTIRILVYNQSYIIFSLFQSRCETNASNEANVYHQPCSAERKL